VLRDLIGDDGAFILDSMNSILDLLLTATQWEVGRRDMRTYSLMAPADIEWKQQGFE
jgi:hypothetical protein